MSQMREQLQKLLGEHAPEMLPTDELKNLRIRRCVEACDGLSDSLLQDLDVASVVAHSIELERKIDLLLDTVDGLCQDDLWSDDFYDLKEKAKETVEQIRAEIT